MLTRRLVAFTLSLLLLLSLFACHMGKRTGETSESALQNESAVPTETETTKISTENDISESISESVAETEPISQTEDTETNKSETTQSMDLNRYMRSLTKFFYESCDKLEPKAFRDDILCLLFSFSYNYGEQLGFADWDEARADESLLVIQGEPLRKVGKMLMGDGFNAWDYHDTLDWGEYIEETDTYEVSFGTDYWGGSDYYLTSGTVPEITEKDDEVIVAVSIQFSTLNYADEDDPNGNNGQAPYQLEYRFRKVISNGFLFYQLVSIKNIRINKENSMLIALKLISILFF